MYRGSIGGGGYSQVPNVLRIIYSTLVQLSGISADLYVDPDPDNENETRITRFKHFLSSYSAPDVVFISHDMGPEEELEDFLQTIRTEYPRAQLVLGGRDPAMTPGNYLERFKILNGVAVGDAGLVAEAVIAYLKLQPTLEGCPGIWTHDHSTHPLQRTDWSTYPELLYGLTPWEKTSFLLVPTSAMSCHFNCTFCVEAAYANQVKISRSKQAFTADQLLELAWNLSTKYQTKQAGFLDLDFFADRERALKTFELLARKGPKGFQISTWATVHSLRRYTDEELIFASREAGFDLIHVGFESFATTQLRRYAKPATSEQNQQMYRRLVSLRLKGGPALDSLFILWDPQTTPIEIVQNFRFINQTYTCPYTFKFEQLTNKLYLSSTVRYHHPNLSPRNWTDDWDFVNPTTQLLYGGTLLMAKVGTWATQETNSPCAFCDRGPFRDQALQLIVEMAEKSIYEDIQVELKQRLSAWCLQVGQFVKDGKKKFPHAIAKLSSFTQLGEFEVEQALRELDEL